MESQLSNMYFLGTIIPFNSHQRKDGILVCFVTLLLTNEQRDLMRIKLADLGENG